MSKVYCSLKKVCVCFDPARFSGRLIYSVSSPS